MRKIEKQMIDAIHFDRGMTSGNTAVIHGPDDTWHVSLHGNAIARGTGPKLTAISLAGWDTVTTRGRLHQLLIEFGGATRVFRHKGTTYITTYPTSRDAEREMPITGWVDL